MERRTRRDLAEYETVGDVVSARGGQHGAVRRIRTNRRNTRPIAPTSVFFFCCRTVGARTCPVQSGRTPRRRWRKGLFANGFVAGGESRVRPPRRRRVSERYCPSTDRALCARRPPPHIKYGGRAYDLTRRRYCPSVGRVSHVPRRGPPTTAWRPTVAKRSPGRRRVAPRSITLPEAVDNSDRSIVKTVHGQRVAIVPFVIRIRRPIRRHRGLEYRDRNFD